MKRRTLLRTTVAAAATVPAAMGGDSAAATPARRSFEVSTTEQNSNRVLTFDKDSDWTESTIKWSWSPGVGGWYNLSDVRFRHTTSFGWVALVAASGGNAGIVNMTGERHQDVNDLLWTGDPGGNPHAIERIPGIGAIITASSGGYLNVYGPAAVSKPSTLRLVQTVTLDGAHGVLWDPSLNLLWASGNKTVRAYKVTGSHRRVRLEATDKAVALDGLGHDLQPDYSDPARLLVTDSYGVYEIDTATLAKTQIMEAKLVKAYVRHHSGEALWVRGQDQPPRPWSSPTVHFDSGDKTFADGQFYKARFVTVDYE
jgi:hypothetical protein